MSDEADRTRARAAGSRGDVESRARVLVDGLRSGARSLAELQLLAYLADPAACLALGEPATPLDPEDRDGTVLWLRGFAAWGDDVLGRAIAAWLCGRHDLDAPTSSVSPTIQALWEGRASSAELERVLRASGEEELRRGQLGQAFEIASVALAIEHADRRRLLKLAESGLHRAPARVRPSPALVAPRLVPWLAQRRATLPPCPGEGPLVQRALDLGTPPARRALVAYLRAHAQARVHYADSSEVFVFHVTSVGFEDAGGHMESSPRLAVHLDLLSIPPGAGASADKR